MTFETVVLDDPIASVDVEYDLEFETTIEDDPMGVVEVDALV